MQSDNDKFQGVPIFNPEGYGKEETSFIVYVYGHIEKV